MPSVVKLRERSGTERPPGPWGLHNPTSHLAKQLPVASPQHFLSKKHAFSLTIWALHKPPLFTPVSTYDSQREITLGEQSGSYWNFSWNIRRKSTENRNQCLWENSLCCLWLIQGPFTAALSSSQEITAAAHHGWHVLMNTRKLWVIRVSIWKRCTNAQGVGHQAGSHRQFRRVHNKYSLSPLLSL